MEIEKGRRVVVKRSKVPPVIHQVEDIKMDPSTIDNELGAFVVNLSCQNDTCRIPNPETAREQGSFEDKANFLSGPPTNKDSCRGRRCGGKNILNQLLNGPRHHGLGSAALEQLRLGRYVVAVAGLR